MHTADTFTLDVPPPAQPVLPQPVEGISKRTLTLYTMGVDALATLTGWLAFFAIRRHLLDQVEPGTYFSLALATLTVTGFWLMLYALAGLYTEVLRRSRIKDMATVGGITATGGLILLVLLFVDDDGTTHLPTYARTATLYLALHAALAIAAKVLWLSYLKGLLVRGKVWFNTILVGSEATAQDVFKEIVTNNPHLGIRFTGFVHVDSAEDHLLASDLLHLGHYSRLEPIIEACQVEQAIIATEPAEHALTEQVLNGLEGAPVRTFILPDTYQILLGAVKVNHILGTPLIEVHRRLMPVWQQVAKRMMDVASALLLFMLGWPMLALVAVLVRHSSPGPIIFSQLRIGRGGKPFRIYKFRSMYTDAERHGPALSSEGDPRITPFGRFMRRTRLDELPQFYNVLRGDMSLVGPRPERQHFIDQIAAVAPHIKYVARVKPGITSLGMVKFGYAENVSQMVRRLRYDIIYIENMSLAMDLRILAFTILIVLKGKGK